MSPVKREPTECNDVDYNIECMPLTGLSDPIEMDIQGLVFSLRIYSNFLGIFHFTDFYRYSPTRHSYIIIGLRLCHQVTALTPIDLVGKPTCRLQRRSLTTFKCHLSEPERNPQLTLLAEVKTLQAHPLPLKETTATRTSSSLDIITTMERFLPLLCCPSKDHVNRTSQSQMQWPSG